MAGGLTLTGFSPAASAGTHRPGGTVAVSLREESTVVTLAAVLLVPTAVCLSTPSPAAGGMPPATARLLAAVAAYDG